MSLNPLAVALQGVGFQLTPIALAVQGLIAIIEEEEKKEEGGSGGGARRSAKKSESPSKPAIGFPHTHVRTNELFDEESIEQSNQSILAIIMAAVQSGALEQV